MKLFASALLLINIAPPTHGLWEFGRDQGHGETRSTKRILGREQVENQWGQPIKVELSQDKTMEDG
jgi:hypothetical protein